jgi:hypothetical protein
VIHADREPGILAKMAGSMLTTAREVACLSYDQAAARLLCDSDWLVRVETGFAPVSPEQVARILLAYGVRESANDRIGVCYYPVLGAGLASGADLHEIWARIANTYAADQVQSQAILERQLEAIGRIAGPEM